MKTKRLLTLTLCMGFGTALFSACSSVQPVQSQAYAKLGSERDFEYDLPTVWKGLEKALQNYKITDRDPDEVDPIELKKLDKRTLETDWIHSQSRDKYVTYTIDGFPRKQYLQTRIKYLVTVEKTMGGTHVKINSAEEIEKLKSDGNSAGYSPVENPDSSRTNEILEKIRNSILSAAP